MSRTGPGLRSSLAQNLMWFAGSVILALFVWIIATLQSDPIQQARFRETISIQVTPDTGLLVTQAQPASLQASVVIRAPRSVFDLLNSQEIEAWVDLSGLGPGEYSLPVQTRLNRPQATIIDRSPASIRVVIEASAERQVPVQAEIELEPPAGYTRTEPQFDLSLSQALASGPASLVERVSAAVVRLDLSGQRNPYQATVALTAVDSDGRTVPGVQLIPGSVRIGVDIRRRSDVREVAVRPNITSNLPNGYVLNALSYSPQLVLVSGTPDQLSSLPDTLSTAPISLEGRTTSFELEVPVLLPQNDLLVLSGQNILVSIEVEALTGSSQYENIPVEIVGLGDGLAGRAIPNQVTVLLTGPQPELDRLTRADVRVALDLNGLSAGNYTLEPLVSLNASTIQAENISVLPAELDVEINPVEAKPTPTPPR